jgi:LSD1 subclass zinc finger protein
MPIPVQCSGCQTRLNAPDSAAGKHVRCSKCQALVPVPEVLDPLPVDDEPPPAPVAKSGVVAKPAAKPAAPPPEPLPLDDDEPSDEPPAKFKKPAPKKKRREEDDGDGGGRGKSFRERRAAAIGGPPPAIMLAVAAVVGLAIVGGVAYTGYALFLSEGAMTAGGGGDGKGGGGRGGAKAAVPAGWREYPSQRGGFKIYVPPGEAMEMDAPTIDDLFPAEVGKKKGKGPPKSLIAGGRMVSATTQSMDVGLMAIGVRFNGGSPADRETVLETLVRGIFEQGGSVKAQVKSRKDVTWLGQKGKEILLHIPASAISEPTDMLVRTVIVGSTGYVGAFGGKSRDAHADWENGFFDNFEVLK